MPDSSDKPETPTAPTKSPGTRESTLRWAAVANEAGMGLYGPSLRKHGPETVCEALVAEGMLRRVDEGRVDDRGYWLTTTGERELERTL